MRRVGILAVWAVIALQAWPTQAQESGFVWLLDRRFHALGENGRWTATMELERKALDAESARNGGRIDLNYFADKQTVDIIEAVTLKSDGQILPVAADKIFDVAPQVAPGVALYSQRRTKSIVFPDVAAGDTIRYVYKMTRFEPDWPGFAWSVSPLRPALVKAAEFTFEYPKAMQVLTESRGIRHRTEIAEDRVRQIFSWSNDKVVRPEAGSTSALDWDDQFSISTYKSFAEIGDRYGRLHAASAQVTPEIALLANEIVGSATDRETQARLLYEWVAQKVRYVWVAIGTGNVTPTPAIETIRNRYGDCKAHVALLAALLAAKGIISEPALINIETARYLLPEVPSDAFDHVILYLPEFDRYAEPTSHYAAFGVLPWTHYGKPVLHAVEGKSRIARIPASRSQANVSEVFTTAAIGPTGMITGTTRETATGAMATDLKYSSAQNLDTPKAQYQLSSFGAPGIGKWTSPRREDFAADVTLSSEFSLHDSIDLAGGEALVAPPGLRFLARPAYFLVGRHDAPRRNPFSCHAGRQIENLEVKIPAGFKPSRLPAARAWETSIASYRSSYAFHDGMLYVRREFSAHPKGEVCTPEQSKELVGLQSDIRRDYRSVVVFDRPL